ncbi:MAG: hypothetical protein H0X24_23350 [Ktedonobacterales bacterium]|nr:hypothetical protein [Ktedonobacterales bacterium]
MQQFSLTRGGTAPNATRPRTPIWLCLVLVAAAAWAYLSQADRVSAANARLEAEQQTTQQLISQHQAALVELGRVTSPTFIFTQAQALGMTPRDWGDPHGGDQP